MRATLLEAKKVLENLNRKTVGYLHISREEILMKPKCFYFFLK